MVPPVTHTLRLEVRATAGYKFVARCSSLSSFIFLKYVYSWLIVCYCICSKEVKCGKHTQEVQLINLFSIRFLDCDLVYNLFVYKKADV
jgi:hypothetical protein